MLRPGRLHVAAQAFPAQEVVDQICGPINLSFGGGKKRQVSSRSVHWGKCTGLSPKEKPGLIDHSGQGCVQAGLKILHLVLMAGRADLLSRAQVSRISHDPGMVLQSPFPILGKDMTYATGKVMPLTSRLNTLVAAETIADVLIKMVLTPRYA